MNRNRPVGNLGGGGWGGVPTPGAVDSGSASKRHKNDKVLADMYEMFLDTVDAGVIECVVHSCDFNHKKSMETLLDIAGSKNASQPLPSLSLSTQPSQIPSAQQKSNPVRQVENKPPILSLQVSRNPSQENDKKPSQLSRKPFHQDVKKSSLPPFELVRKPLQEEKKIFSSPSSFNCQDNERLSISQTSRNYPSRHPNLQLSTSYFPQSTKKHSTQDSISNIRWYIENGKRILVLMRGCPGSGKSYLAKGLIQAYGANPQEFVFSTDDYFVKNNIYNFNQLKLNEAHSWNQTRVLRKAKEGCSPIIIDNTNTQLWEMTVYGSIAINHGYAIEILEPETPWFKKLDELARRNKHGVPRDKIRGMLERYEHGITVEGLITATGAKYSRPPPQTAEKDILKRVNCKNLNWDLSKPVNRKDRATTYENLQSPVKEVSSTLPSSPSNSDSARGSENCYPPSMGRNFSSASSSSSSSYKEETNNQGSPIPFIAESGNAFAFTGLNISQNSKEKGFLFSEDFKARHVPIVSKEPEINVEVGESSGSSQSSDKSFSLIDIESKFPHTDVASKATEAQSQDENGKTSPSFNTDIKPNYKENDENSGGEIDEVSDMNSTAPLHCGAQVDNPMDTPCEEHQVPEKDKKLSEKLQSCSEDNSDQMQNKCDIMDDDSEEKASKDSNTIGEVLTFNNMFKNFAQDLSISKPSNDSNHVFTFSAVSNLVDDSKKNQIDWEGCSNLNDGGKAAPIVNFHQNPSPKPPRASTMKDMQDYCDTVKNLNAALQNEEKDWSISENAASWQTIDKIQEEVHRKELSLSPLRFLSNSQRARFKNCDVREKETNTNHADFCILSNPSSYSAEDNVTILNAYDRDINHGRPISEMKIPVKLMLDKGTYTENDFEGELKKERRNKRDKIIELHRLFPNRSPASIKELLKQCDWDVNYVSNILLDDTDTDPSTLFSPDENNIPELDLDSSAEESEKSESISEDEDKNPSTICPCPDDSTSQSIQKEAENVKRHLEQTIGFSERCYSRHTLAIRNFRRGLREGAIPKSALAFSGDVAGFSNEAKEMAMPIAQDLAQASSDVSEGDEGNETLEFIIGKDFIQQLVDKFGGFYNAKDVSPVVKFPVNLARQIYDVIFSTNEEEEEDDGDIAMKLQCEEDERMAHQLYEEMLRNANQIEESNPPKLREIMDMELAQAIYRADVNSITQNPKETMANVLAKRLLEDNYSHVDKKTLHDIFASCNCSFEDTVKTLQEAFSSERGQQQPIAKPISTQVKTQSARSPETQVDNAQSFEYAQTSHQMLDDSTEMENPWTLSDPKDAYERYREQANQYLRERDEMYRKANEAFRRQQRSVAAYYSKLGELHGKKFHHMNAMAAAALAAAHTKSHSSDTLDLHHFKVVEAITVFDLFMDHHISILSENGLSHKSLEIITGRGTHSVNGKPRIKPAIISRIRKRNLSYQHVPSNPGVVRVTVSPNALLSYEIPE